MAEQGDSTDVHVDEAALSAVIDKLTEIVQNPQSVEPPIPSTSTTPGNGKPQEIVVEIIEEAPNIMTRPIGPSQISLRILSDHADQKQICDLDSQISSALKSTSQGAPSLLVHHENDQSKDNVDASSVVVVESIYKCEECDYSSANKHYLKQHIDLVHNASRIYKCPFCDYAGKRSHSLKEHLIIHSNDRPFECTQCNATFRKKGHLTNHIKMHATRCEICDLKLECESKENIVEHMRSAHGKQEVFFCSECNFFTVSKERVVAHIDIGHKKSPNKAVKQAERPVGFLYKCSICDHECSKNEDMVAHIKDLHVPTPQVFSKKGSISLKPPPNLRSPQMASNNRSLIMKCSVCGYETKQQTELKQHMWQHVQGDPPSSSDTKLTPAVDDINKSTVSNRISTKPQPALSGSSTAKISSDSVSSILSRSGQGGQRSSLSTSYATDTLRTILSQGPGFNPKTRNTFKATGSYPIKETPVASESDPTRVTPRASKSDPTRVTPRASKSDPTRVTPGAGGSDLTRVTPRASEFDTTRVTPRASGFDPTRVTPRTSGSDPTEYSCGDCTYKSTQVYPFITHMLSHKPKVPTSPVNSSSSVSSTSKCTMAKENTSKAFGFNTSVGMFYCRVCGYQCESQRTIKSHIWKHTGHKDIDYPMFQNGPLSIYEGTPLAHTRRPPSSGIRNKPEALGNPHDNIFTIGKNTRVKLIDQHTAILKVDEPIKDEGKEALSPIPLRDCKTQIGEMLSFSVAKDQKDLFLDDKANQNTAIVPNDTEPLQNTELVNNENQRPTNSRCVEVDGPSEESITGDLTVERANDQMEKDSSDLVMLSKVKKVSEEHVNIQKNTPTYDCSEAKTINDEGHCINREQQIMTSDDETINEQDKDSLKIDPQVHKSNVYEEEPDNEREVDETERQEVKVDAQQMEDSTNQDGVFIPPAAKTKEEGTNVVVEHVTESYNTPRFNLVDIRHSSPRGSDIQHEGDLPAFVALQPVSHHQPNPHLPDDDSALTLLSLLKKGPNYNPAYPVGQPCKVEDLNKEDNEPGHSSPPASVTDSQGTDDSKPKSGICSSLLAVIEQLRERSKSGGESADESVEEKVVVSVPRARGRNKKIPLSRKPKDDVLESNDKVEWIRDTETMGFFRCKLCHYTSASVSYMKQHMRFHKSKQPFECSLCPYIASSSESLQDHMLLHCKVRTYACKLCDSVFSYKSQLRAHLRAHNYLESFMCDLCEFETNDGMKFRAHMSEHEVKMFKCSMCHQLMEYSDLSTHTAKCRKSLSNTAYQCNQCKFVAGDETEAREHADECHLGIKSQNVDERSCDHVKYKCEHCEYTSTTFPAVKLHMKVHDEASILKCVQCDFSAMSLRSLKSHMKRHINDQRYVQQPLEQYKCNLCGYVCHHLPSLKSHMWRHASDENYSYEITNEIINSAIDFDNMTSLAELKKSELKPDKISDQPFDYKGKEKYCFVTFRCCQCGFETIDKPLLSDHMKSHTDVIRHTLEIKHQQPVALCVQTDSTDLKADTTDDDNMNSEEGKKSPLHEAQMKSSKLERNSRKRLRKSDIDVSQENRRSSKKPNLLLRKSQRKAMNDKRKARSSVD